ncbi:MAG TPA: hypothetical protein VLW52_13475 [Opitutaceae bacterium]|nr:hypothetical protein [Opitutaceae bacterium]
MPLIKTTRTARVALWALRIYLLVLLALIGLKFVRMSHGSADKGNAAVNPVTAVPPRATP